MDAKLHALVVDPDEHALRELAYLLDRLGVRVEVARRLTEASERLSQGDPPGVVFCSARLEDGEWCELCRLVPSLVGHVVVTTRLPSMREYLRAMDEGARDYIARPFALREIEQIVRSFAPSGTGVARARAA